MAVSEPTYAEIFGRLSAVDVSPHVAPIQGFDFLNWAWALTILYEHYPQATWVFHDNEKHDDGSMTVHCTVAIGKCIRHMHLPVMDYTNKSITGDKGVGPSSREISDNKMRCLVKCLALFGLGMSVFLGHHGVPVVVESPEALHRAKKELQSLLDTITKDSSSEVEAKLIKRAEAVLESGSLEKVRKALLHLS
jgi:hypothetical protein